MPMGRTRSSKGKCSKKNGKGRVDNQKTVSLVVPLTRNKILPTVKGKRLKILVDTGASISCADMSVLKSINITRQDLVPSSDIQRITGVGGEMHAVLGKIDLPISIDGLTLYHSFYVFQHLFTPILIGMDFLDANQALINFVDMTVTLCGGIAEVSLLVPNPCHLVKLSCDTVIPPKSQCVLPVKVPKLQSAATMLIAPTKQLILRHYLMGSKCVHEVRPGNVLQYMLINPTNSEVKMKAHTVVATAAVVDDSDITSFLPSTSHNHESNVSCVDTEDVVDEAALLQIARNLDIDLSKSDLTPSQKRQLLLLIGRNRDCFAASLAELGTTHLHYPKINTGDSPQVRQRFYRQSPEARAEADRQIEEMEKCGIIRKSNTEWNSPIVMVKKKSGGYRLAVDYRKVNSVTKPMHFHCLLLKV